MEFPEAFLGVKISMAGFADEARRNLCAPQIFVMKE